MSGTNSFNVGRDGFQLTIVDSVRGPVTFSGITSLAVKPAVIKLKSVLINGRIIHRVVPDGHAGTIDLDRMDASFDSYFADVEADYFAGLAPNEIYVTHTIRELDGSTSQWQYIDCALAPEDAGTWKGQDKITERCTFDAGRKIQVA